MNQLFQTTSLLLIFFITSCVPGMDDTKRPDDVISKENMPELLRDLHILESYLEEAQKKHDTLPHIRQMMYEKVMEKHDIDSLRLHTSLQYYSNNAHILGEIYPEVTEKLNQLEGEKRLQDGERD